ncbi:MAG: hypothetical protein NTX63_03685 [Candidatus Peregrinibacteria bacterium]|nr:hypothetical protein [Candidatus Peregrinibacteria bacterium]
MLHRLISKIRAYKKLSLLCGTILLVFFAFLSRDMSRAILVDILSDVPTETVVVAASAPTETVIPETPTPVPDPVSTDTTASETPIVPEVTPAPAVPGEAIISPPDTPTAAPEVSTPATVSAPVEAPPCAETVMSEPPPVAPAAPVIPATNEPAVPPSETVAPIENPIPAEPATNVVAPPPVDTPVENVTPAPAIDSAPTTIDSTTPAAEVVSPPVTAAPSVVDTAPACAPKQAITKAPEPIKEVPVEEPVVKKVEQNIPFVDLETPKTTAEKEIIIDTAASQSCNAESFHVEMQRGHSQVIPLLLQGSGGIDNTVKIGDEPKGTILTFVANGLKEITGISFDNLMISADIAPDAQEGSFNVPIIYSISSKNEVSNAMCQLNLVIQ